MMNYIFVLCKNNATWAYMHCRVYYFTHWLPPPMHSQAQHVVISLLNSHQLTISSGLLRHLVALRQVHSFGARPVLFPCQHSKPQNGALRKPHSRTLSKRYFSTRSRPTKGCPRGGAFGQGVSTTDRFLSRDKIKVYLRSADCPGIFYTYTFLFCCLDFAHLCKHFTCRCAQRA